MQEEGRDLRKPTALLVVMLLLIVLCAGTARSQSSVATTAELKDAEGNQVGTALLVERQDEEKVEITVDLQQGQQVTEPGASNFSLELALAFAVGILVVAALLTVIMIFIRESRPIAEKPDAALTRAETQDRIVYSALLGLSVVVITQFTQRDTLSDALTVSLYSFGAAVPVLAFLAALRSTAASYDKVVTSVVVGAAALLAHFLVALGLGAILWHFSWGAVVVFLVVGGIFFLFYAYHTLELPLRSASREVSDVSRLGSNSRHETEGDSDSE